MGDILSLMGYVQDQGEKGRARGLSQLIGKAYNAPPDQRQAVLGQVANVDGGMAMDAQKAFGQQDEAVHDQIIKRAAMVSSLYKANPQMAAAAYQGLPELAQRGGFGQVPAQLDDKVVAALDSMVQAAQASGDGDDLKSLRIGANGNYWAIRGGQFIDTGTPADPRMQLRDQPGIDPGLVNLRTGSVTPLGGAPQGQPSPQRAPGEVPFSIDPSLPPEVQADIRASESKYAQAPDGADIGIGGGGGMPQPGLGGPAAARPAIAPAQQQQLQLAQQAAQRAQEASQRAATAQELAKRGNAPAGYRFKADGSLEPIPGAPATASAETSKQDVYAKNMAQDALAFAAAFTGLPQAQLAQMTPEQVKAEMLKHDRMTAGPIVGSIWGMGKLANADLEAYSNSASGKQARINNPTGPVTNADFEVARKSVFSADKPKQVNADLVYQALSRAKQAPQQAKPAQGGGAVPRAVNPQTGQTLELRNGQWVPAQ